MAIAESLYQLLLPLFDLASIGNFDRYFVYVVSLVLSFILVLIPFWVVYKIISLFLR